MRLFHKIALVTLTIALVPLAALGFSLIRVHRQAITALITDQKKALADANAERVARELAVLGGHIGNTVRMVDAKRLTEAERAGLLRAIYEQSPDIVSVRWVDRDGKNVLSPLALEGPSPAAGVPPQRASPPPQRESGEARVAITPEDAARMDAVAFELAKVALTPEEVALSEPLRFARRALPSVFFMTRTAADATDRLLVEVSLRMVRRIFDAFKAPSGVAVALVDRRGEVLIADGAVSGRLPVADAGGPTFRFATGGDTGDAVMLGALAPIAATPLAVVVTQSEQDAFALVRTIQAETLAGLGGAALLALAGGFALSRNLRRRLTRYEEGARAFGQGDLARRLAVDSADELGVLAETLNQMAHDLGASRARIEAFNRELQDRVEARTAELRAAQAQLVRAARLTAVGQLGAGVAHEIGNPLSRVIGHAQLLQLDARLPPDARDSLGKIEAAAKRVSEITHLLLRFSQTQDLPLDPKTSLMACAREAAGLCRAAYDQKGVLLEIAGDEAVIVSARPGQIVQAIYQVLDNSKNASLAGKRVRVTVGEFDGVRGVAIADQGHGIAQEHLEKIFDPFFTTKQVWESAGLGLSLVYRIMEENGGQVSLRSEVGVGTEVRLLFGAIAP